MPLPPPCKHPTHYPIMTATTYKNSPTEWLEKHKAEYAAVLSEYAQHPAAATDEPAHTEHYDMLHRTMQTLAQHPYAATEDAAAKLLADVYRALGQMALSIRGHLGTAYREDALYQRINAMRPAMVRQGVLTLFNA